MKLGRVASFDSRSRSFPVRSILRQDQQIPRSYSWYCPYTLDQGNLSACVGFSWSHVIGAYPDMVTGLTNEHAIKIYKRAQRLDGLPDDSDTSGTTVIAGVKALRKLYPQTLDSYRWCFGIDDLMLAVGYVGPAVLGISWFSSMYNPDSNGVIQVSGSVAGGHAIACVGVDLVLEQFILLNSWGPTFGIHGQCRISFSDMTRLLNEQGEACLAVGKHAVML